MLLWSAF